MRDRHFQQSGQAIALFCYHAAFEPALTKPKYTHVNNQPHDPALLFGRYFLYIGILGLTDLVLAAPKRVADLYEIKSTLNTCRHESFGTIVFRTQF